MSEFEFPTNIRQIGSIGEGLRIYIEDYAYTYLKQYAEAGGYEERIALLVGRQMVIDGNKVLFISGALQGKYAQREKGITFFSDESMNYCYEKMETYFRGLEVVGWMQSQPSYGVLLNSNYAAYHASTFLKPDQVLFVMDPVEDLNAFYTWNVEKADLEETRGYFIYYDKNRGMQEYMLENRVREKPTAAATFRLLARSSEAAEPAASGTIERAVRLKRFDRADSVGESAPVADSPSTTGGTDDEDKGVRTAVPVRFVKPRTIDSGASTHQDRRLANLLVSLSAVLVLVCFIIGAGLIQSEGRISDLEQQLVLLTTSLRNLASMGESTATSAFAVNQEPEASKTGEEIAVQPEPTAQPMPVPVLVSPTPTPTPTPDAQAITNEPDSPVTLEQPTYEPPPVALVIPETYTVEAGDSLLYISRKFYGSGNMVSRIMELNGISDPDTLYIGATIRLPQLEPAS